MVMVGIAKIKIIDVSESCLPSIIFSVGNFFANWNIPYLSHSYLVRIKGFKYKMQKKIIA